MPKDDNYNPLNSDIISRLFARRSSSFRCFGVETSRQDDKTIVSDFSPRNNDKTKVPQHEKSTRRHTRYLEAKRFKIIVYRFFCPKITERQQIAKWHKSVSIKSYFYFV